MCAATVMILTSYHWIQSLPTSSQAAYSRWFSAIEPHLWNDDTAATLLPFPVIEVSVSGTIFNCNNKELPFSQAREILVRQLRLIDQAKIMREPHLRPHSTRRTLDVEKLLSVAISQGTLILFQGETSLNSRHPNIVEISTFVSLIRTHCGHSRSTL